MATPFRQEKLDSIFLKELNAAIQSEVDFGAGIFVTVTGLQVAANLASARILISCLPFSQSAVALKKLQEQHQKLIVYLNQRMKFRKIPRLLFEIDDTEEQAEKIESLMEEIKE
jgi:ribosome-binding factor A